MNINSVLVGDSPTVIQFASTKASIRAQPDAGGTTDIVFEFADRRVILDKFVDSTAVEINVNGRPPVIGGVLRYIVLDGAERILLLGLSTIVTMDLADGTIRSTVQRFRADDEDHGFHHEHAFAREENTIIVYEGGAALFSKSGDCHWHVPLTWNDTLIGLDAKALHFSREVPDGPDRELSIRIRDGQMV